MDFVNIIEKMFLDCLGSVMYSVGHRPKGVRENYIRVWRAGAQRSRM